MVNNNRIDEKQVDVDRLEVPGVGEEQAALLVVWGSYSGQGSSLEIKPRFELFDRTELNRALSRVAVAQAASFGLQKQPWEETAAWLPAS